MVFKQGIQPKVSNQSIQKHGVHRCEQTYTHIKTHILILLALVLGDHNKGKRTHLVTPKLELAFKFVLKTNCRFGYITGI